MSKSIMDLNANDGQIGNSNCAFDLSQQDWSLPDTWLQGPSDSMPNEFNSFRKSLKKNLSQFMFMILLTK